MVRCRHKRGGTWRFPLLQWRNFHCFPVGFASCPSVIPRNEIVNLVNGYTAVVHSQRFSLLKPLPNPYADRPGLTCMRSEKTRRGSTYRRLRKFLTVDLGFVENIVDEK